MRGRLLAPVLLGLLMFSAIHAQSDSSPPSGDDARLIGHALITLQADKPESSADLVAGGVIPIKMKVKVRGAAIRVPEAFADFMTIRVQKQKNGVWGQEWHVCQEATTAYADSPDPVPAREMRPEETWEHELELKSECGITEPGVYHLWVYYSMPPNIRSGGETNPLFAGFWEGELADELLFTVVRPKPGK